MILNYTCLDDNTKIKYIGFGFSNASTISGSAWIDALLTVAFSATKPFSTSFSATKPFSVTFSVGE